MIFGGRSTALRGRRMILFCGGVRSNVDVFRVNVRRFKRNKLAGMDGRPAAAGVLFGRLYCHPLSVNSRNIPHSVRSSSARVHLAKGSVSSRN
jgi:hypothetical protein